MIAGRDEALQDYVDTWILRQQDQGLIETLFAHWVMLSRDRSAG